MIAPLLVLAASGSIVARAENGCREALLPVATAADFVARNVVPNDILLLRDIGRPEEEQGNQPIFSVSPDGEKIAFQIRRADPATNGYCLGIYMMDLKRGGPPILLDMGGELIRMVSNSGNFSNIQSGFVKTVNPKWSPDGKSLAFLKRLDSVTQLWTIDLVTKGSRAETRSDTDVEDFAWVSDRRLVYSSRPGIREAEAQINANATSGYLYDTGFNPRTARPFTPPTGKEVFVTQLGSLTAENASPEDASLLRSPGTNLPDGVQAVVKSPTGAQVTVYSLPPGKRVATGSRDPAYRFSEDGLRVEGPGGWRADCASLVCDRTYGVWIDDGNNQLLFLRRQGWLGADTVLYRWPFGAKGPERLLSTRDNIVGCAMSVRGLTCGLETPIRPRRLVAIDPRTGRVTPIFDPNPEFAKLRMGEVIHLEWENAAGYQSFGKLVLPPGLKPGEKAPLVVVQYESRGFLRGGTGDEYPIHALAARGIAVLSTHGPRGVSQADPKIDRSDRASRWGAAYRDWNEYRNVHASLEAGLAAALATGRIDPDRIGISGFSAGAATVHWAMLHSTIFKAAAVSGCCEDEFSLNASGLYVGETLRAAGWPNPENGAAYFREMSLPQNVERLNIPYLMQLADSELPTAMATITTLKAHDKPIEAYIYPDEFHRKWQPRHRAIVYERNLDWFSFWLQCREDSDPRKATQYARWRGLLSKAPMRPCATE